MERPMTAPPATRISDDELAYLRVVRHRSAVVEEARNLYVNHLSERYGLKPGDQIAADGALIRATTAEGG